MGLPGEIQTRRQQGLAARWTTSTLTVTSRVCHGQNCPRPLDFCAQAYRAGPTTSATRASALAASITSHLTISAVERDTGLSKDVLRVWERRYGFPTPLRDGNGERLYAPRQVERLRTIRRLMDAGHRPGRLLTLTEAELLALSRPRGATDTARGGPASQSGDNLATGSVVTVLMAHARACETELLAQALAAALLQRGLSAFVRDVMLPLLEQIDDARLHGDMPPFAERYCREQLRRTLLMARGLLAMRPAAGAGQLQAVAVLATLPHDTDDLPLLAAEALLLGEGMHCLSLGMQAPVADIATAANQLGAAVVVPSFAASLSPKIAMASLEALREALPAAIPVWAVGELIGRLRREPAGVTLIASVDDIARHARLHMSSKETAGA